MSAMTLPRRLIHSNDSHTHFACDAPTPPPTGNLVTTPRTDSPNSQSHSRSSSPLGVRHSVSPEQVNASCFVKPIDELVLSNSGHPRPQTSSVKPNPRESSTSKARDDNPIPSPNIHQLLTKYFRPSLVLQNTGSVARDHLASERTFLAYVRTSLGMASAGVALVQLFTISHLVSKSTGVPLPAVNQRLQKFAAPLGLSAVGMAFVILLIGAFLLFFYFIFYEWFHTDLLFIGAFRYFVVQHALPENKFPPTRRPIVLISFGLGSITVIAFAVLLSGKVQSD